MSDDNDSLTDKQKIAKAFQIQSFTCPHKGGIEYPCVICKQCREMDLEQYVLKNGMVERTKNSSLISLTLDLKDPFDDMLLNQLSSALAKDTGIIQNEAEPGFSITFYLTTVLLERVQEKNKLIDFIADFEHKFLTETIAARSALNRWKRQTTKRLINQMTVIPT